MMAKIISIIFSIILLIVCGLPFLIVGIRHKKDKYYQRSLAILEIIIGCLFIVYPFVVWSLILLGV